ncbi:hypothetical protein [Pontibacterium sp.]|uniref:hypothetical protein n=1 Tax=Pontibacterium sp. TaxID=2036026 RepID=UPI003564C8E9
MSLVDPPLSPVLPPALLDAVSLELPEPLLPLSGELLLEPVDELVVVDELPPSPLEVVWAPPFIAIERLSILPVTVFPRDWKLTTTTAATSTPASAYSMVAKPFCFLRKVFIPDPPSKNGVVRVRAGVQCIFSLVKRCRHREQTGLSSFHPLSGLYTMMG